MVGLTARYGSQLKSSYPTTLFSRSRTANPSAVESGWYVYASTQAGYVFNQIFTDGNTFKSSRSIDYDHEFVSLSAGIALNWKRLSFTFAITDSNLLQGGNDLTDFTRYGTLIVGWRL